MTKFSESGHPIFRVSSAIEKGELRSKVGGKKSTSTGVIRADICDDLSESFRALGKPKAPDYFDKTEIIAGPSVADTHANEQQRRNLVQ